MASAAVNGVSVLFGWAGNTVYRLFSAVNQNSWLLKTKLWDGGAPMLDKQAIVAGIGVVLAGQSAPGFTMNVDSEYLSLETAVGQAVPAVEWVNQSGAPVTWVNNSGVPVTWIEAYYGYNLLVGSADVGGGKYVGITATGAANNTTQIRLLALAFNPGRRW
jgi:hypothetical protein